MSSQFGLSSHSLLSSPFLCSPCILSSIMTNWTVVQRKMKDKKKRCAMLVLPHASVAKRNKAHNSNKTKKWYKEIKPWSEHGMHLFNMMIDTWPISLVINFYLNLKTYFITCINFLDIIVWQKLNQACESEKMSKTLWMGHGWVLHGAHRVCMRGIET